MGRVSWQIRKNKSGGESIFVRAESDINTLPTEFRQLLDARHERFLTDPQSALLELKDQCQFASMRIWFSELAKRPIGLLLHRWEPAPSCFQNSVVCYGNGWRPGFCLAAEKFHSPIPELAHLFSLVSRTVELEPCDAGGLEYCIMAIESWVIAKDSPFEHDDQMTEFYRYSTGDSLVAKDGNAYFHSHEINNFQLAGSIADVIEEYFNAYVKGLLDRNASVNCETFSADKFYRK